jgi:hypothetical protein
MRAQRLRLLCFLFGVDTPLQMVLACKRVAVVEACTCYVKCCMSPLDPRGTWPNINQSVVLRHARERFRRADARVHVAGHVLTMHVATCTMHSHGHTHAEIDCLSVFDQCACLAKTRCKTRACLPGQDAVQGASVHARVNEWAPTHSLWLEESVYKGHAQLEGGGYACTLSIPRSACACSAKASDQDSRVTTNARLWCCERTSRARRPQMFEGSCSLANRARR